MPGKVACMAGGMCGRGACMAGGVCGRRGKHGGGGMHGRRRVWQEGQAWRGACMACMLPSTGSRYYEIRSMSGRYASYWNAFLFFVCDPKVKGKKAKNSRIGSSSF